MYKKLLTTILCFALAISFAVSASAKTYYVSPEGDDANPGSENAPFATIQKASKKLKPGDTCLIRAGTYDEVLRPRRSGKKGKPIVFKSYPGEQVILSALSPLNDWVPVEGIGKENLFKAQTDIDLGQGNMVMANGRICDLARWPNKIDPNPFALHALRNSGGTTWETLEDARLEYAEGIPEIDWTKGGYLFFFGDSSGSGWLTWRSWIKASDTTSVTFDLPPRWVGKYHAPADFGEFFLQGAFGALDYEYEWYLNSEENMLYLQLPDGGNPAKSNVLIRNRDVVIDLHDRSFIEVRDLAVLGGSIEITGSASHNTLFGVTSYYGNYTSGVSDSHISGCQSVNLTGDHNIIEKCEIAYGSGTGIYAEGSYNQILNCSIHDFGFLGNYDGPVNMRNGDHSKLMHNTIYNGGRDGVKWFHKYSEMAYNDVFHTNLIAHDCGPIYTLNGPFYSEIHHNWFHDVYCREESEHLYKGAGLYLDNSSYAHKVHHNVVWNTQWSSLQINWNGRDLEIYNNTFWNGSQVMDYWRPKAGEFEGIEEDTEFVNVNVWNNLSNDGHWDDGANLENNMTVSTDPFVDSANGDFRLEPGAQPIDAGISKDGYSDVGYQGEAPDIGAYEHGGEAWKAGIDWDESQGPAGHGDYGILTRSSKD